METEIARIQQIIKRLKQSGSASASQLQQPEAESAKKTEDLKLHKQDASKAQDFYRETTEKCKNDWEQIKHLEAIPPELRSEDQQSCLSRKKQAFTLVLSADYQQAKLIPYWGYPAQPGSTYYFQKVSNEVFGIIDHCDNSGYIFLFDERIGPKNTDHTLSYLEKRIQETTAQYPWISRVLVFLDNATSTNKNRYLFSWDMEKVEQGQLDYIRFCFMVAGHTKFTPDRLFAQIANSYNKEDVFTMSELQAICSSHAHTTVDDGTAVLQWRESISTKYSDLPGVHKHHDFLIARGANGSVAMKLEKSVIMDHFRITSTNHRSHCQWISK